MTARVFDRKPSKPDPVRQERYGIAKVLGVTEPSRSYTWGIDFVLDQGTEGACVAHGCTNELVSAPVKVDFARLASLRRLPVWAKRSARVALVLGATEQEVAQAFAFDLYDQCRKEDEWPGEDYDGTSAAAGAKIMKELGFWHEYLWASSAMEAAAAIVRKGGGPGTFACDWYTGMMDTDSSGFIYPTGQVEGGHQVCLLGYNMGGHYFLGVNSWGASWGISGLRHTGGIFKLHVVDMAMLLSQGGEFCIPRERGNGEGVAADTGAVTGIGLGARIRGLWDRLCEDRLSEGKDGKGIADRDAL